MPKVKVKLFAIYRELAGQKQAELELPDGTTVRGMLLALENKFEKLRGKLVSRVERDRTFVLTRGGRWPKLDDIVHDGEEYSLFPPIGGG